MESEKADIALKRLSVDNGKPVEKQGRKATGPKAKAMAAWPPKWEFFVSQKTVLGKPIL